MSYPASGAALPPRPKRHAADGLEAVLGGSAGPILWGFSTLLIGGMTALAVRTSRRTERATTVIEAAEKIMRTSTLQDAVGPVVASGTFQLATSARGAQGWFSAAALASTRGKGRVYIEAARPSGRKATPWEFSLLRVELDKEGLLEGPRTRREQSVKAGYMSADAAADAAREEEARIEAAAKAAGGGVGRATDPDLQGEVFLFPLVGDVGDTEKERAEPASSAGGSGGDSDVNMR